MLSRSSNLPCDFGVPRLRVQFLSITPLLKMVTLGEAAKRSQNSKAGGARFNA